MLKIPKLLSPRGEDLTLSSLLFSIKADYIKGYGNVIVDLLVLQGELRRKHRLIQDRVIHLINETVKKNCA